MCAQRRLVKWSTTRGHEDARTLVVLLHGMDSSPATIEAVASTVETETVGSYILIPDLPLCWRDCCDLKQLACEILIHLRDQVNVGGYESILLVGHSAGGILAQVVYLISRADPEIYKVDLQSARLVLLAPINRGWEISHHLPLTDKLSWSMGLLLLPWVKVLERLKSLIQRSQAAEPWILQMRRSSPFMVWLRLQWLDLNTTSSGKPPKVVQLLGSLDEIISWRDMIDVAAGEDFVYFEVPFSDHMSIIDLEDPKHGPRRRAILAQALAARGASDRR